MDANPEFLGEYWTVLGGVGRDYYSDRKWFNWRTVSCTWWLARCWFRMFWWDNPWHISKPWWSVLMRGTYFIWLIGDKDYGPKLKSQRGWANKPWKFLMQISNFSKEAIASACVKTTWRLLRVFILGTQTPVFWVGELIMCLWNQIFGYSWSVGQMGMSQNSVPTK